MFSALTFISDQVALLKSALCESNVAHSTKASGLGQLVASVQDHILQAVEDSTKTSSQEHGLAIRHLEHLCEAIQLLLPKTPGVDTQLAEGAEKLAVKEALEQVEKSVSGQGVMVEKLHKLKTALDLVSNKLSNMSVYQDILAKLEALGNWEAPKLEAMIAEELVRQIQTHISSLELPTINLDLPQKDSLDIMAKIDELSGSLAVYMDQPDLSGMRQLLEEIKEQTAAGNNIACTHTGSQPLDLSDILMKLDGISAMCQSLMESRPEAQGGSQEKESLKQEVNEKLMQLLAALCEDAEHWTAQAEQTSELVWYLNELNIWLEKFVANASIQMENVGAGIGAIHCDLGLDFPSAVEGHIKNNALHQSILEQLHTALDKQAQSVGEVTATLSSAMSSMHRRIAQDEENRQQKVTEAVQTMIDAQRQEQEQLLCKLATDLSSDIRGEQLRFIEAMSHTTSVMDH